MEPRLDTILNVNSVVLFKGTTEEVVAWLDFYHHWREIRWISIGETGDLLTESQYLDLAS